MRDIDLFRQRHIQHAPEMFKLGAGFEEKVLDVVKHVRVRQAFGDLLTQNLPGLRDFGWAVRRKRPNEIKVIFRHRTVLADVVEEHRLTQQRVLFRRDWLAVQHRQMMAVLLDAIA